MIEPEVAGGWGERTVVDTAVHPPRIRHLHYQFDGWLGDEIIESFPCLIVSQRLAVLFPSTLTGFELAEVEISKSEEFEDLCPGRILPAFRWLKVNGTAGVDDFGVAEDNRFVISQNALETLRQGMMSNCGVEEWRSPATGLC